jgi:hypothetical protein
MYETGMARVWQVIQRASKTKTDTDKHTLTYKQIEYMDTIQASGRADVPDRTFESRVAQCDDV